MNNRIRELVKQAGINLTPAQFSGVLEDEVSEFDLEKFAELIIQECSTHLKNCASAYDGSDTDSDYMEAMLHSADMIKEHFGVE